MLGYHRNIISYLRDWKNKEHRKPLIIRGARQVGKTYAVNLFAAEEFESLISLNLEKQEHSEIFDFVKSAQDVIQTLELRFQRAIVPGRTLLFIDEIQQNQIALQQLRYFYEEMPQLHVIAAGSLLEVMISKNKLSIPVGRLEYCYMHPLSFDEFLLANGNKVTQELVASLNLASKITDSAHRELMKTYMQYAFIGGMPEIVAHYAAKKNFLELTEIYESLLVSFRDDIAKYASGPQSVYLRHCLEHIPRSVGMQIAYNNFADSNYRSREISASFDLLELAQLVRRVYSSRSLALPLVPNHRKPPKILFLDVGLVNYKLGQRDKFLSFSSLENIFQGQVSEQIVGQTLVSLEHNSQQALSYWYRDKKGSSAELDFLIPFKGELLGIEVKAGSSGKLRSLISFINESKAKTAIRVYSGNLAIDEQCTPEGQKFTLISIPYYMLHKLPQLL